MPKRAWKAPGFQRRAMARVDYPGPDAVPAQAPPGINSARSDAPLVREAMLTASKVFKDINENGMD